MSATHTQTRCNDASGLGSRRARTIIFHNTDIRCLSLNLHGWEWLITEWYKQLHHKFAVFLDHVIILNGNGDVDNGDFISVGFVKLDSELYHCSGRKGQGEGGGGGGREREEGEGEEKEREGDKTMLCTSATLALTEETETNSHVYRSIFVTEHQQHSKTALIQEHPEAQTNHIHRWEALATVHLEMFNYFAAQRDISHILV